MILGFRTSTYARNIYIYGTTYFAAIPAEYHEPVKQFAAANYTIEQIDHALENGWITQTEYEETLAYVTPSA